MSNEPIQILIPVHRATLYTLHWAMVFCRNFASNPKANMAIVYDLMDAIHEIPNILERWGTYDNDIKKLRLYFGCFNYHKWENTESYQKPPDLVSIFNDKLAEFEKESP